MAGSLVSKGNNKWELRISNGYDEKKETTNGNSVSQTDMMKTKSSAGLLKSYMQRLKKKLKSNWLLSI